MLEGIPENEDVYGVMKAKVRDVAVTVCSIIYSRLSIESMPQLMQLDKA